MKNLDKEYLESLFIYILDTLTEIEEVAIEEKNERVEDMLYDIKEDIQAIKKLLLEEEEK